MQGRGDRGYRSRATCRVAATAATAAASRAGSRLPQQGDVQGCGYRGYRSSVTVGLWTTPSAGAARWRAQRSCRRRMYSGATGWSR